MVLFLLGRLTGFRVVFLYFLFFFLCVLFLDWLIGLWLIFYFLSFSFCSIFFLLFFFLFRIFSLYRTVIETLLWGSTSTTWNWKKKGNKKNLETQWAQTIEPVPVEGAEVFFSFLAGGGVDGGTGLAPERVLLLPWSSPSSLYPISCTKIHDWKKTWKKCQILEIGYLEQSFSFLCGSF